MLCGIRSQFIVNPAKITPIHQLSKNKVESI